MDEFTKQINKANRLINERLTFSKNPPERFPYSCRIIATGKKFTPTMIDYDNQMAWNQKGQASGNGEWFGFDELMFDYNPDFKIQIKIQ